VKREELSLEIVSVLQERVVGCGGALSERPCLKSAGMQLSKRVRTPFVGGSLLRTSRFPRVGLLGSAALSGR
jgi:hypothetical protein